MSWRVVCTAIAAAAAPLLYYVYLRTPRFDAEWIQRADEELHPLLRNHTEFRAYKTQHANYPSIRTFYRPHSHKDKLKAISDLPLLVFIHGMGGCLPQFAPVLGSFVNLAPCFAIELPGHGLSRFAPSTFTAYTIEAFVDLWKTAIDDVCAKYAHTKVVLIGHSMGSSIGALLASSTSPIKALNFEITGLIAICPKASPPTEKECKSYRRIFMLPDYILNVFRWYDRRGHENSASVFRYLDEAAGIDLRRLQFRWNKQFKTPAWKRTAVGLLPRYDESGMARGGFPGVETWKGIRVPLFLIAGEDDTVTKPGEVQLIVSFVTGSAGQGANQNRTGSLPLPIEESEQLLPVPDSSTLNRLKNSQNNSLEMADTDIGYGIAPTTTKTTHHSVIKTTMLPSPAKHALLYDHRTYRTVAGLIEDFLASHVSSYLSLGWQLQQLTTSGKWDVKNLRKWQLVLPVSGPIAVHPIKNPHGLFRALKTLREQDDVHTPAMFLKRWADKIFAVVDISHDAPVYDTKSLERGGVQYHKFPTVSKIPPTVVEVHDFIALVDRLVKERDEKFRNARLKLQQTTAQQNVEPQTANQDTDSKENTAPVGAPSIAVHCHYGYNRTGFFIICYLVEKLGYKLQDAIEEFAIAKPPGIKHDHFLDTLSVRYAVGLKRAPTMDMMVDEDDG